jgi:hypothetical protein
MNNTDKKKKHYPKWDGLIDDQDSEIGLLCLTMNDFTLKSWDQVAEIVNKAHKNDRTPNACKTKYMIVFANRLEESWHSYKPMNGTRKPEHHHKNKIASDTDDHEIVDQVMADVFKSIYDPQITAPGGWVYLTDGVSVNRKGELMDDGR